MLLVLAAVLGTACAEPTGLGPVVWTYVARTVDGQLVPAPLRENTNYERLLVADTLRLGLSGRAEWTRIHRTTVGDLAPQLDVMRTRYSYQLRGDSIYFAFRCPPDADCVLPPRGKFSPGRDHLVVQVLFP